MQRRLILFFQILLLLTVLLNIHAAPTRVFEDQFNGNQGWAITAPSHEVTFNGRLSVNNLFKSKDGPHIVRGLSPQLQTTLSNNGYWRLSSRFRYTDVTNYGTDAISVGTASTTDPRGPNTYNILSTHANLLSFSISGMGSWGGTSWQLPIAQANHWWQVTLTVTGNNWHFQFRNETTGDIYQRSGTAGTMPVPRSIVFGQQGVQEWDGNFSSFENDYIIIELDTDRPTITHTLIGTQSSSDPAFYTSPVTIGFNASDNCSGCINSGIRWIEYKVNSNAVQQVNNSSTTTNVTSQGIHTFQYRTQDNAGNQSNWVVGGFAIDSLPPTTSMNINGTLSGSWYTTHPTITLNATDPNPSHHSGIGSTAYRINGASAQIYTTPFSIQNDGLYVIRYSSIDRAGNVEAEQNETFTVDTTPPTIDVSYTDADLNNLGNWRRGVVTAQVNAQDAVSGIAQIEYRLNSGNWTTYSGNMTFSGEGQQTIAWRVTDRAGHMTSRTDTIQIDNTAPQTQIEIINTSPVNGWYAVTPQISLTATDTQSGVEQTTYEINGGITQTYSGQFSLPTSGEYTITYRSRDLVGNVEADQTLQLSVDIDPPLSTHAYSGILGLNNWYVGTGELSFSAIDAHSGVEQIEYQLDSGAWEVYSQPLDLIADGVHQIRHRATDYAEHVETQRTATIQIDTLAPETTLTFNQVPVNGWYPADVELILDAVDTGSGVFQTFYSLDGGGLQIDQQTPIQVQGDGLHILELTSVDYAGNTETPKLIQFSIDTTAPITTALYNSSSLNPDWYTEDVTVVFQGHDDGAGIAYIEYTLNGSGWQRYSNPFTLSANGEHEINYRSVDRVGHIGAIQSDIVRIDQTNPELSIHVNGTRGAEGWFVSPVTMRLDFRDPVSGIERTEYEIGAGWQTYQTPIRLTTEGQTRINASTYDRAGNYRVADTLVKIDTLPPTMTRVSCPERAPMGDLIIQTNANDLSSGIVRWEVVRVNEHGHTWTFSGAGDGRRLPIRVEDGNFFTFQSIKLVDRAGHIFVSPLDCYVVLDLQAPEPIVPTEQPTVRPTQTPFPTVTLTPTPTSTPTATRFIQFVTNTPRPITTVIAASPTPTTTRIFGAIPTLIPLVDRMMTRVAPLNTLSAIDLASATPTLTPTLRSGQPLSPIQTAISFFDRVLTQIAPTITPTPTSTHTPTATATATNTLTPTSTITRTPAPTATPTQFVAMGELPSGGGTNSNSQDDNLSLEQALLATLLATGTVSVVGAKVAEAKEKRQQAVKADNQANDKANQQKIAQAEKVKQDDQAYAKSMVEQLQQHGQFWLSAALVSVLGVGVCAYLLSNPQYDHLPIAYDCEMGLVQHVVPSTSMTIVQYPSTGTKNPFIGANPFVMIAVLGFLGELLKGAGKVSGAVSKLSSSPLIGAIAGIAVGATVLTAGLIGHALLNTSEPEILARVVEQANDYSGFISDQTADEFIEKYRQQEPCLLVQAIPTDDPNIFEFIAHPFNVPEGYQIEWSTTGERQSECQGSSCRIRFNEGEHHVTAKLIVDDFETSVILTRNHVNVSLTPTATTSPNQQLYTNITNEVRSFFSEEYNKQCLAELVQNEAARGDWYPNLASQIQILTATMFNRYAVTRELDYRVTEDNPECGVNGGFNACKVDNTHYICGSITDVHPEVLMTVNDVLERFQYRSHSGDPSFGSTNWRINPNSPVEGATWPQRHQSPCGEYYCRERAEFFPERPVVENCSGNSERQVLYVETINDFYERVERRQREYNIYYADLGYYSTPLSIALPNTQVDPCIDKIYATTIRTCEYVNNQENICWRTGNEEFLP